MDQKTQQSAKPKLSSPYYFLCDYLFLGYRTNGQILRAANFCELEKVLIFC